MAVGLFLGGSAVVKFKLRVRFDAFCTLRFYPPLLSLPYFSREVSRPIKMEDKAVRACPDICFVEAGICKIS